MRLVRTATALAVAGSLFALGSSQAATAPVCNLVTDPAGDANGFLVTGLPVVPSDDYLDILSADIATDSKALTAVVRLKAVGKDSAAPTGATVYFNFAVGDVKMYVNAVLDGSGSATFAAGDFTGTNGQRHTIGDVTGVIDPDKKEIRITAPISTWPTSLKSGTILAGFNPLAQRYIGNRAAGGVTPTADDATSEATYKTGTKNCVAVGK